MVDLEKDIDEYLDEYLGEDETEYLDEDEDENEEVVYSSGKDDEPVASEQDVKEQDIITNNVMKIVICVVVFLFLYSVLWLSVNAISNYKHDLQNEYISSFNLKLYDTKTQQACVKDLELPSITSLTVGQYLTHEFEEEQQAELLKFISLGRVSYAQGITYLDKADNDGYKLLKMNTRIVDILEG